MLKERSPCARRPEVREAARLKAEVEATQRAEAEAREKARVAADEEQARVETEAKQRAETEAREKARLAAEEAQRTEVNREAEERARAEAEARKGARIIAEEEARRYGKEKVVTEEPPSEPAIEALPRPKIPDHADETPRPPTYCPTAPPATTSRSRARVQTGSCTTPTSNTDLRLRVQLVFGRGGVVRSLALAADRRDGMPNEIEVTGTQGEIHLADLRDDCYEPVKLEDAGNALLQGIEWRGRGDAGRWRWVLGGREIYVLVAGDQLASPMYGFVSTARLCLNSRHVVLAAKRLQEEVLAALAETGCTTPEVSDDTTPGVPTVGFFSVT